MKIISKIISGTVIASILTCYASPVLAYMNEETIYSNLDASGKVYQSTVTTVTEDKNGTINTKQEETNKELPIETKITYYLDGKEIDSSKITGANGRVKIKVAFENKEKQGDLYTPFVIVCGLKIDNQTNTNIEIKNGKLLTNGNSTIAVGLVLPGMQENLNLDKNTIKIPSFVEISMDTKKFELGNIFMYASPKLLGGLNISMEDFDEIFDQMNALETAAKALENGANTLTDGIKTLDIGATDLSNGAKTLNDGVNTLKAGTIDLSEGVNTLNSQYGVLDSGLSDLEDGVSVLNNGVIALDDGAGSLVDGISQVSDGANSLASGISQVGVGANNLATGISQVDTGANNLASGINQVEIGASNLTTGISQVDGGINNLITGIESKVDVSKIEGQKETLQTQISTYTVSFNSIPSDMELQAGLEAGLLTPEQVANYSQTKALLEGLITSLQANYDSLEATEQLYSGLTQLKNGIEKEDGLLAGANSLVAGISQVNDGANGLVAGISQVSDGANSLVAGIGQVDTGANSLVVGINQVSNGASSLKDGTEGLASGVNELSSGVSTLKTGSDRVVDGLGQLATGSNTLKDGVITLSDGTNVLYEGTLKLTDGSKQLVDGSQTLADGIKQFNQEGISKISDLVNTGKDLIRKVEKLEKLSNDYTSFASKEERDDLKFIAITDSVKVENKSSDTKSEKSKSKK